MKSNIFRIQGDDSLRSIQGKFNNLFPAMQIRFFMDPETAKQSDQQIMLSADMKVNNIIKMTTDLVIEITPYMRVIDLENIIKSRGLHAQISCRIANRKLPESSVSKWMLKDVFGRDEPHEFIVHDKKNYEHKI